VRGKYQKLVFFVFFPAASFAAVNKLAEAAGIAGLILANPLLNLP
jgi:hypothetical protein